MAEHTKAFFYYDPSMKRFRDTNVFVAKHDSDTVLFLENNRIETIHKVFKYMYNPADDSIVLVYKTSQWSSFCTTSLCHPKGGWSATILELYEWLGYHLGLPNMPKPVEAVDTAAEQQKPVVAEQEKPAVAEQEKFAVAEQEKPAVSEENAECDHPTTLVGC